MVDVIRAAVRDRERPLREPLRVPYGVQHLTLTVGGLRRRSSAGPPQVPHPQRGPQVGGAARLRAPGARAIATTTHPRWSASGPAANPRCGRRWSACGPCSPRPSCSTTASAHRGCCAPPTTTLPRAATSAGAPGPGRAESDPAEVVFTHHDVPLLDEALERLGPRPRRKDEDAVRTYGHIVVDEAQDLSPMQLRVLDRRSLNGSMTIVGDIAQSTGAWAHDDWESVLEHLPAPSPAAPRGSSRSATGSRVRSWTWPHGSCAWPRRSWTRPRRSATAASAPRIAGASQAGELDLELADLVRLGAEGGRVGQRRSGGAGVHGRARRRGARAGRHRPRPGHPPGAGPPGHVVHAVAGEGPGAGLRDRGRARRCILAEEARGPQSLYVAVTRSTKRLSILHTGELPDDPALTVGRRRAVRLPGRPLSRRRGCARWRRRRCRCVRPSISTVAVPSGDMAVSTPAGPGQRGRSASRKSSRPGANSSSSGIRSIVNPEPTSISANGAVSGAS